jgi:hypothetical protein
MTFAPALALEHYLHRVFTVHHDAATTIGRSAIVFLPHDALQRITMPTAMLFHCSTTSQALPRSLHAVPHSPTVRSRPPGFRMAFTLRRVQTCASVVGRAPSELVSNHSRTWALTDIKGPGPVPRGRKRTTTKRPPWLRVSALVASEASSWPRGGAQCVCLVRE